MRVYISGAITGQEDTARERFHDAEEEVKRIFGRDVEYINPYEVGEVAAVNAETLTHSDYMGIAIGLMFACDTIYMMPGWEKSRGCQLEREYAEIHKMKIIEGGVKDE